MLIYSTSPSPRLAYTLEVLFQHLVSLEYTFTDDFLFYQTYQGPKIHYGDRRHADDVFFLKASSLLFERDIQPQKPALVEVDGRPALFPLGAPSDWPFDLLAMIFYCVSRYEEYLPFEPDRYKRFPASESLAYQHQFLHRPILNEWAQRFGETLQAKWPTLKLSTKPFHFRLTFDIDMAWAYLHRPWWRLLAGGAIQLLSGRWAGLAERIQVLQRKLDDPFHCFKYLDRMQDKHKLDTMYFWLLGDPGKYDLNAAIDNPDFRVLIQQIAERYPVGIHPSFASNTIPGRVEKERDRLVEITGKEVTQSRQHFLMLSLPDTYRRLIALGITDDYSMGYADQVGYRAGMTGPFPWYDLQKEERTDLRVHPFAVMDVSLNFYLKLQPKQAALRVQQMMDEVRKYGGTFTLLWHNSSFAEQFGWAGWTTVFEDILEHAAQD
ncbi:MAG: hypothetical protein HRU41_34880 [Saprospiraceae bacterium]|nr:hypothetical protein [Saprospiraceae bacterium]